MTKLKSTAFIVIKNIVFIVIFTIITPTFIHNIAIVSDILIDKKSQRNIRNQILTEWYSDDLNIHLFKDIDNFIYGSINLDGQKTPIIAYIGYNRNFLIIEHLNGKIDEDKDYYDPEYIAKYRCDFRNKDYFKATLTENYGYDLKEHIFFYKTSENVYQDQIVKEVK